MNPTLLRYACLFGLGLLRLVSVHACPTGEERAALEGEIVRQWGRTRGDKAVRHVAFVHGEGNAPCLVLVSVNEKNDYCHAAGATTGLAEIARDGSGPWRIGYIQRSVTEFGQFGRAPVGRRWPLDPGARILAFELDSMHQGIGSHNVMLVAKVGGAYKEVLLFSTHEDNDGSGEEELWSFNSTAEIRVRSDGTLPDIVLRTSGTEKVHGKIRKVDETTEYVFQDGDYRSRQPVGR